MQVRQFAMRFSNLIFSIAIIAFASGFNLVQPATQTQTGVRLRQFDMLTAGLGWVLLNQQLFWTSNEGRSWTEISPSIPAGAIVQDVQFIDFNTGWILWTTHNPGGDEQFTLAHTIDHGVNWNTNSFSLFATEEIPAQLEKADMGWFDAQNGWVTVKQVSGSNFSLGMLFITNDGGNTWRQSSLPVADQIHFNNPQFGWAVRGPAGDQIFQTQDAGLTWQDVTPSVPEDSISTIYMPSYSDGQGLMLTTRSGSENNLDIYKQKDSSQPWRPVDQIKLNIESGVIGLSILDPRNFVAVIGGTSSIVRMQEGKLSVLENQDGLSDSIVELDMVSLDVGWARSIVSNCVTASSPDLRPASISCASHTRLLQTSDGGLTWQSMRLPLVQSDSISSITMDLNSSTTMESISNLGNTEIFIGQGFDKCEIPPIAQLQNWWNSSPYKTVNLYIGGSSRACDNAVLTPSYLEQLYQQGWKFIPTWVGPQAPCTGFLSRMSSDVTTAYNQGVSQANLAVERLAELGLTYPDKTGSVIYYDIEHYGTNTACRSAVNAFMNGWVAQIHARGNLAGVYGSTLCNTGLSDFRTIANVPDVVWPARWYHNLGEGFYDPNATVWNLGSCIPNTVWADHQRIRQYEGDHDETWGNLTLGIDSNVLDGVVAIPYVLPYVSSITRADPDPSNADTVNFNVVFSEAVTGVDTIDFKLSTTGVIDTSISGLNGSGDTYTITVNTGSGDGTIRLDIPASATVNDLDGNALDQLPYTSGETYTVNKMMIIAQSFGSHDGWILESNETSNLGGSMNSGATTLRLGDDAANKQYRALLSFDTSSLPDNASVTSVTFKFKYAGKVGTLPFNSLGNLVADVRNGAFRNNPVLQLGDFNTAASKAKVLIFTNSKVDNWYSQSFNSADFVFINLSGVTQFRLRFSKDDNNDFGADFLKIYSGNASLADQPQLIVEYSLP